MINSGILRLLIENCVFNGCKSTADQAGAVYCAASNAEVVFSKVCGYGCYTPAAQYRQFGIISNNNFKTISCYLLSISHCSPFTENGNDVIVLNYGKQYASNVNSSNNNVLTHSGFFFSNPSEMDAKFINLINNKVKHTCLRFRNGHHNRVFYLSNVIGNNSPSSYAVLVSNYGEFFFEKNIFLNNQNTLFMIETGTLIFYKCWISHTGTLLTGDTISFLDTSSQTNTHIIKMYASNSCLAISPFGFIDSHPYQEITSCPINSCHIIMHQPRIALLLSFTGLLYL